MGNPYPSHCNKEKIMLRALSIGLACILFAASAALAQKPMVGVLDFKNATGRPQAQQYMFDLTTVIVTSLKQTDKFRAQGISKATLQKHNLVLNDDNASRVVVKAGKLLGVNYLLTGVVSRYGHGDILVGEKTKARRTNRQKKASGLAPDGGD